MVAAGISSGIDGSFHLIRKMQGLGVAQMIALSLEYDWDPSSKYVRAQMADQLLPRFKPPEELGMRLTRSEGDSESWLIETELMTPLSADEILDLLGRELSSAESWTFQRTNDGREAALVGRRRDDEGTEWRARVTIESGSAKNTYRMQLALDHA